MLHLASDLPLSLQKILRHTRDNLHDFVAALTVFGLAELLALVLNEAQFSVVEVSLFFDRLDVVEEKFMVFKLLKKVLLERRQDRVDLLDAFWCQRVERL